MKILIVYAHPEEKSFNAAMKNLAVSVLTGSGHQVKVSDLYQMRFNAAADRGDFLEAADPAYLNIIMEHKNAAEKGLFARDIKEEQEKLLWADFVILQFPFWWFGVPAILKGWFDRVLATGFAWDFGRMYDAGLLAGKKGMCAVTTGGPENLYRADGPHGVGMEDALYGVNHGTLYFCGIRPCAPFVAYSVFQAGDQRRKQYLEEYRQRLLDLENAPLLQYHSLSDFDEQMKLKKK